MISAEPPHGTPGRDGGHSPAYYRTPDYFWMPIPDPSGGRGSRHVFRGRQPNYRAGERYPTLCLEEVTFTTTGDWIWFPSCRKCWDLAKSL